MQLGTTAALAGLFQSTLAKATAIPANRAQRSIRDVEHVVVLMQENRSFDHYFGTLNGVRGFNDPHPLTLANGRPVWNQSGVLPFRPDTDDLASAFLQDLPHDWNSGHKAFNNGHYDQWVPNKGTTTMAHVTRRDMPFHFALADAFTICDSYHCSLIGPTDPNRYYMWTGYTGNDGKGGGPVVANDELGYDWTTYPERLEKAGVSWKIYQDIGTGLDAAGSWGWGQDAYIGNYGDNSLLYFHQYQNAQPGSPLYEKARRGTDISQGGTLFDQLQADVKGNKLPQVSWICAPEAYTEHPNWPVKYGEWYVAKVLEALTSNPDVWSKTVLLLTYDENDGFFDHILPAYPEPGTAGEYLNDGTHVPGPYGLGQRVPMLVISPFSKGGFVCSETFDHTSIIRFIENRFGVAEPQISDWRRTVCGDLTSALDFSQSSPGVVQLPDTSSFKPTDNQRHPDYVPVPPVPGKMPVQETGKRRIRPLPYKLSADVTIGSTPTLNVAAHTAAGACLTINSAAADPASVTVRGNQSRSVQYGAAGAYAFEVHGPAGFFRYFAGAGAAAPEVAAEPVDNRMRLRLTNSATTDVTVTVKDELAGKSTNYPLKPHTSTEVWVEGQWYDLTLTCASISAWQRKLAGPLDSRAAFTDPRLG